MGCIINIVKNKLLKIICILVVIIIALEIFNLSRPLAAVSISPAAIKPPHTATPSLPWPAVGQAAIGTTQDGLLGSSGAQKPVPTASTAKVITALAVLKQKPLNPRSEGPSIPITASDVAILHQYIAKDGSVVPVVAGEQMSEYEALQAMMLPSANNIADSLAIWAFGSIDSYTTYANKFVRSLGMTQTTVSDASGFSPQTVSTAKDMLLLGKSALADPVLADIMQQRLADTSAFGRLYNINVALGHDGIIGIKTGNTDEAGGCYLVAANRTVQGQTVTVIATVLNDLSLRQAMTDGQRLIEASDGNFKTVKIPAGLVAGTYKSPSSGIIKAVSKNDANLTVWRGQTIRITPHLKKLSSFKKGDIVGTIAISSGNRGINVPVTAQADMTKPSLTWRLTHF